MNIFKIIWYKLIQLLLPTFLRKQRVNALLDSAVEPVQQIDASFQQKIEETFFLLKYDTGKRNAEIALRKRFKDEGIYIQNAVDQKPLSLPFSLPDSLRAVGEQYEIASLPTQLPFVLKKSNPVADFTIYVPEITYITHAQDIYNFASYFILPVFKYNVQRY